MSMKANRNTKHLTKENCKGVTNVNFPKAERLGEHDTENYSRVGCSNDDFMKNKKTIINYLKEEAI